MLFGGFLILGGNVVAEPIKFLFFFMFHNFPLEIEQIFKKKSHSLSITYKITKKQPQPVNYNFRIIRFP